jgi:hypothetical protein
MPILTYAQITQQSDPLGSALQQDGTAFAQALGSQLQGPRNILIGFAGSPSWSATYLPAAAAADRAARFGCVQLAVVGTNPALVSEVTAAFGVPPLGKPVAIVVDLTPITQAKIAARVQAALDLAAQVGATPINTSWTAASIATWVTSASNAFQAQWVSQPPGGDPSQSAAYINALASFNAAVAAASAYVANATFK